MGPSSSFCGALLFLVLFCTCTSLQPKNSTANSKMPTLITPDELKDLIDKKTPGLKVFDVTFQITPKPNFREFKQKFYGNFPALITADTPWKRTYLQSHIPTAQFLDLETALFPSRYQRYALYPPELIEDYLQLLGINEGDHIVLYSRGLLNGFVFASKAYWLLLSYGITNVSILNGGYEGWTSAGYDVWTDARVLPEVPKGNITTQDYRHLVITYEELLTETPNGVPLLFDEVLATVLDARPKPMFDGTADTTFNRQTVPGSYIPSSKNLPLVELFANGVALPVEDLQQKFLAFGFDEHKTTITLCNLGMQGSVLATLAHLAFPTARVRLYNGSLKEIEARNPQLISGEL